MCTIRISYGSFNCCWTSQLENGKTFSTPMGYDVALLSLNKRGYQMKSQKIEEWKNQYGEMESLMVEIWEPTNEKSK